MHGQQQNGPVWQHRSSAFAMIPTTIGRTPRGYATQEHDSMTARRSNLAANISVYAREFLAHSTLRRPDGFFRRDAQ